MGWVVFYHDGSMLTSEDKCPWDLPRTGVLAIFQPDPSDGMGWCPRHAHDYYCYQADVSGWAPHDFQGMLDYLALERQPLVIRGYWVPYEQWDLKLGAMRRRLPKE